MKGSLAHLDLKLDKMKNPVIGHVGKMLGAKENSWEDQEPVNPIKLCKSGCDFLASVTHFLTHTGRAKI